MAKQVHQLLTTFPFSQDTVGGGRKLTVVVIAILSLVVFGQLRIAGNGTMGDQPAVPAEDSFQGIASSIEICCPEEVLLTTKIAGGASIGLGK
jgi:hypothetical protein